jgi:hypothetical protein
MPKKYIEFSGPQVDFMESTASFNLFHAGVGSGKSHVAGAISLDFAINNPEVRGFIAANTYSQLSGATLSRIFDCWANTFNVIKNRDYVVDRIPPPHFKKFGAPLKGYENIISFVNGATIFVGSLENYQAIDGTEFGWAILDETKDTREEAVKEVIVARLRQKGMWLNPITQAISKEFKEGYIGYNPLFILTSPAKTEWLMKWFELDKDIERIEKVIYSKDNYYRRRNKDKLVVISSTYHNEHNLPVGYIDRIIDAQAGDEEKVKMLVYGSPFGKAGGEFYHAFKRTIHVKKFEPWQDEVVHLSFDFNIVPYITCVCFQIKEETNQYSERFYRVRAFKEFCLESPKNNSESLCIEIENEIGPLLRNGMFYYGDYSGKTNNTVTMDLRNNFDMIQQKLYKYLNNSSNRVIRNQPHIKRRDFVNKVLFGGFPIIFEVDESCVELIADLEFVQLDPKGSKLKTKTNGVELRGHTSDGLDYFFTSAFDYLYEN